MRLSFNSSSSGLDTGCASSRIIRFHFTSRMFLFSFPQGSGNGRRPVPDVPFVISSTPSNTISRNAKVVFSFCLISMISRALQTYHPFLLSLAMSPSRSVSQSPLAKGLSLNGMNLITTWPSCDFQTFFVFQSGSVTTIVNGFISFVIVLTNTAETFRLKAAETCPDSKRWVDLARGMLCSGLIRLNNPLQEGWFLVWVAFYKPSLLGSTPTRRAAFRARRVLS